MARPSTIDRLPAELRDLIGRLREQGRTIDEIRDHLAELDTDISRSALGRHIRKIDAIGAQMRASRAVAEALVARFGDQPDDRLARLNIELMHGVVMNVLTSATEGEEVTLSAQDAMFLGRSLQSLAQAARADVERIRAIEARAEERARTRAVEAIDRVATESGLSAERIAQLRREFLGVRPRAAADDDGC